MQHDIELLGLSENGGAWVSGATIPLFGEIKSNGQPASILLDGEVKINRKPAREQLEFLGDLSVKEVTHPSKWKMFGDFMAVFVGMTSSYVYYGPSSEATKNKSTAFSIWGIFCTIFTNAILNAFFNLGAMLSFRFLRDPVTGELSVPRLTLFMGVLTSFASSFAFAFLDVNDPDPISAQYPTLKWINFFFQIFNYTAQHYFGIIAGIIIVISIIHYLKCCVPAAPESQELHAKMIEALESSFSKLSNLFYKKEIHVDIFYKIQTTLQSQTHNALLVPDDIKHSREIDVEELLRFVTMMNQSGTIQPVSRKNNYSITSIIRHTIKALIQIAGLVIQVIGNIGYGQSTFDGFKGLDIFSFRFSSRASVALASSSMAPVLLLSFIMSWETVNKIGSMIPKVITAIRRCDLDILIDEAPLAIKKTRRFSFFSGALLIAMGFFSYFTALRLLDKAIYDDGENSPEFGFVDPQQEGKAWYDYLTIISAIIFNCSPVPEVQATISAWYLKYFKGTPEDKQQLKVLDVMETWIARAKRIPPSAFTRETPENKTSFTTLTLPLEERGIPEPLPLRKKNLCVRLTENICNLWNSCFSNSGQQDVPYHELVQLNQ